MYKHWISANQIHKKNKINKKERNNKEQFITLNRKHASTKNRCDGQSS
jgi:hypothetical protein